MVNQIQDKLDREADRIFRRFTREFIVVQLDQNGRYTQKYPIDAKINHGGGVTNNGLPYSETTEYDVEVETLLSNRVRPRTADGGDRRTRIQDPRTGNEYRIINTRENGQTQVMECTVVSESRRVLDN